MANHPFSQQKNKLLTSFDSLFLLCVQSLAGLPQEKAAMAEYGDAVEGKILLFFEYSR